MKMLDSIKLKSVQLKITLWTGLCLILAAAIIIAYAAMSLRTTAVNNAEMQAVSLAESKAAAIDAEIEIALDAARTIAQLLTGIKDSEITEPVSRAQVNAMLRNVLEENPTFVGVYTLWEPDAFDGNDDEYAGTRGHDETGRFIPYWNRSDEGTIHLDPLTDYDTDDDISWFYQCPRQTRRECVLNPYTYTVQGEEVLMTSLVVPIIANDTVYGIAGIDFPLQSIQTMIDNVDMYDGTADLLVVSHDGTLAAVSDRTEMAGEPAFNFHEDFTTDDMARVQRGEQIVEFQTHEGTPELEVFVPIKIGRTATPWSMNIIIPSNKITEGATQLMWGMIGIGSVLALTGLVLLWFVAGQIARPIRSITTIAHEVSSGNFNVTTDVTSSDEIGKLATSFNNMIYTLRQKIENEQQANERAVARAIEIQTAKERIEGVVNEYLDFVNRVSGGDLTARLSLAENGNNDNDETLIKLGQSLNRMAENLGDMTTHIRTASSNISAAASEILAAASQQASSATEQSSAIVQTTTTIEEIKGIARRTTQEATLLAQESQMALQVARQGTQTVEETVRGMEQIRQKVESISQTILALSEQTQAISLINTSVAEIADQSNMLALNAAIEAARAGEQGKSFAVVAQQVRDLAERSKAATAQVKDILTQIQRVTHEAVMVTEEGTKSVEAEVQLVNKTGKTIHQVSSEVENGAQGNVQIASAAQQQMTGVDQVAQAMQAMKQASQQTLASIRQTEQAARDLNALAQSLEKSIAVYRLVE
jgi:methyl-accepting chemotaxis protein